MDIQILCTLGPSSLDPAAIARLDALGVDLYRINLSHTPVDRLEAAIEIVRGSSSTPLCLDTEGPQVRCGPMQPGVVLRAGEEVALVAATVTGSAAELTLWPRSVFSVLEPGSRVCLDFDGAVVEVVETRPGRARALVLASGRVRSNKGATVAPAPVLPSLYEKDLAALEIGARHGIRDYALSFAASGEEVAGLRRLAPDGARIIAKIESRAGVRNADAIIEAADAILLDRGDLSREVPLAHVPYYQKSILRRANRWSRPAYVATNLLESMVQNPLPTVAEANDIANTLLDGAHGLVLAAETAVGVDPVAVVRMIRQGIRAFELNDEGQLLPEDRRRTAALAAPDAIDES